MQDQVRFRRRRARGLRADVLIDKIVKKQLKLMLRLLFVLVISQEILKTEYRKLRFQNL